MDEDFTKFAEGGRGRAGFAQPQQLPTSHSQEGRYQDALLNTPQRAAQATQPRDATSLERVRTRLQEISMRAGIIAATVHSFADRAHGGTPQPPTTEHANKPKRAGIVGDIEDTLDLLESILSHADGGCKRMENVG